MMRPLILVIVLACGLWFCGSYAAQWWLVGRIAHRLHSASDVEAPRLVRELARREGRAYQALVQAANSPRATVALSARREIDLRVDRWERESYLSPATFDLRGSALPLARAFAKTSPELSPSARRWARQVLEKLADFAQSQPLEVRLELITQCDRALAGLPRDDQAAALADAGAVSLPILLGGDPLEPKLVAALAVPNPPLPTAPLPEVAEIETTPERQSTGATARHEDSDWQRVAPLGKLGDSLSLGDTPTPLSETATAQVPAHEVSLSRPPQLPSQEIDAANQLPAQQGVETLEWFERLARGNVADQARAQERLFAAGYGQVRRDEALMMLSASTDDRKALVNRVLTSPRLEASAWFELLLADAAPEVRAATVAAIATSGDERLLQRAEDVALRDPAPAVADQLPLIRRQLR